jgi:hypothetical protein
MGANQGLCGKDTATASSSIRVLPGVGSEMAATTGMMRRWAKYCRVRGQQQTIGSAVDPSYLPLIMKFVAECGLH